MAKRGRGGAGIGSRMSAQNLPFEIDPDLVEAADQSFDEAQQKSNAAKELFPDYGPVFLAAPITDSERKQVQILRELDAKRRAGPFWTGTKDDWVRIDATSGRNVVLDPFECAGRKSAKRTFRMADLRRVKLEPKFFPKELYKTIGHNPLAAQDDDGDQPNKRQKRLGLSKKSAMDKLARFDDDYEEQVNGETNDEEDTTTGNEEGEDFEAEPEDDVFDEDDDDANNDYNAEQYFDGGEDDFDEGGGGEGGDDVF